MNNQEILLGSQSTTGAVHLSTIKFTPRCGTSKTLRYNLTNFRGGSEQITCKRCIAIQLKISAKAEKITA